MRMQQIWKHEELSKHDIWIKYLLENQRVGRQRNVMSGEESSG